MEQEAIYVGVDVAKIQVDVAVRPSDEGWVVDNDGAGLMRIGTAACGSSGCRFVCLDEVV